MTKLFGDWTLTQLDGREFSKAALVGGNAPPTLSITPGGEVSGFGGVNRLTSSLDPSMLTSGDFSLAPIACTMMAGNPDAMSLESEYLVALGRVRRFSLDGDALSLTSDGKTLLKYVRSRP